jgi:hypothetical protein
VATVQLGFGPERLQWLQYNLEWSRETEVATVQVQLRNGPERLQWLQYNLGMVQRGCNGYRQLKNVPERLQWLQYNLGIVQRGCSGYSTVEIRGIPEVALLLYS